MYENEEIEQLNSDASEASSEPQQEVVSEQNAEGGSKESAQAKPDNEDNTPFHKHPRWIERDNELKSERQARESLEQRYRQMEQRLEALNKPKETEDELMTRLKDIDPKFAERFGKLDSALPTIEALNNKLQAMERQAVQEKAVSSVKSLHDQFKVPAEQRDLYEAMLRDADNKGMLKRLEDIPGVYKSVHENISKMIEGVKRSTTQSYVADKKADTRSPSSQPKGKPAVPNTKFEYSKDPETAKAQIVSRYLKTLRAEGDV